MSWQMPTMSLALGQNDGPISGVIAKTLFRVPPFSVWSIPYIKSSLSPAEGYSSDEILLSKLFCATIMLVMFSKMVLSEVGVLFAYP